MATHILVVDDETAIADLVEVYLKNEGFTIHKFYNASDALACVRPTRLNLAVLDVMLPDMDGFTLCQRIREDHLFPIIMLTAKVEDMDKIMGLTLGADDYITKPFNPVEVAARVRSQLRRYFQLGSGALRPEVLTLGTIQMDDREKTVAVDGDPVALTPTEYDILKLLLEHPGQVFSPREIYRKVWKDAPFGSENTVAVHIRHLREKIEIDPAEPRYLKVVWGQGYKLEKGMRA